MSDFLIFILPATMAGVATAGIWGLLRRFVLGPTWRKAVLAVLSFLILYVAFAWASLEIFFES